ALGLSCARRSLPSKSIPRCHCTAELELRQGWSLSAILSASQRTSLARRQASPHNCKYRRNKARSSSTRPRGDRSATYLIGAMVAALKPEPAILSSHGEFWGSVPLIAALRRCVRHQTLRRDASM